MRRPAAVRPSGRRPTGAPRRRTRDEVRRRQREEYGGLNWGSAFFGWLVAVGVADAADRAPERAPARRSASPDEHADADNAGTIGIVGGILLLAILAVAYYAGGYVAGRMARFNGPRQGLAVWLIGLIVTVVLAVAGVLLGAEYNVLSPASTSRASRSTRERSPRAA